jgi:hypothetical protein
MDLPLTTLDTVLEVLFRGRNQPEVQEVEFTPFDLSHLKEMPRETGQPGSTKSSPVTVYPPPVPFNSPQI